MAGSSMFTAVSALQAQQQYMDVVSNNLANVDTVGFKATQGVFADALSQTLQSYNGGSQVQVGLGVKLASAMPSFTQGAMQNTGVPTDMAISGNGFFVLQQPVTAPAVGQYTYTRAGAFTVDQSGYLVDPSGYRLQGLQVTDATTTPPTYGAAMTALQIPPTVTIMTGTPAAAAPVAVNSFTIDSSGNVNAIMADNSSLVVGKVSMQGFSNPSALQKIGNSQYLALATAGPLNGSTSATPVYNQPGTNGSGTIQAGYLESSNVDIGQEFSNMISAQRGLEANTKVITTADEIMQDLLNIKR